MSMTLKVLLEVLSDYIIMNVKLDEATALKYRTNDCIESIVPMSMSFTTTICDT